MANSYESTTRLHIVDSVGNLSTVGVTVVKVVFIPAAVGDDLVLTDTSDNTAIVLKENSATTGMLELDFGFEGRKLPSLKCGTIDGGTAYIYLKMDRG